jgi:hypothetical protein
MDKKEAWENNTSDIGGLPLEILTDEILDEIEEFVYDMKKYNL